jgi:hypothetical protein
MKDKCLKRIYVLSVVSDVAPPPHALLEILLQLLSEFFSYPLWLCLMFVPFRLEMTFGHVHVIVTWVARFRYVRKNLFQNHQFEASCVPGSKKD